ncbi:MAG: hypothetical protein M9936_03645 [Caldilinea sp.]|nr:hypothetical protein [Caldilinea sp.]MCW5843784.1 hypothetical protein [Caldilinea sp.]
MEYFLGIDIGGTKSHALLTDAGGNAVGFAEAGPGNHEDVGYAGLIAVLTELVDGIERSTGIARTQIAGAGFGVAGYDWPSERAPTLEAIAALGLTCPVDAVNDTIIGLLAGAEQGWGVALVAGTSNNCRGWDRRHREGRVLGNGPWFGEHGGAAELVMRAVRDVSLAWTQRGPQTRLTEAFVEYVGAVDAADLLEGLSQETYALNADAARLVVQVAQEGDEVAQAAVRWTAQELGSLAVGVIRQLALQAEHFDLVLVGSFYNVGPLLMEPLRATILAEAPHARLVRLAAPPVAGAVLLGMLAAGRATDAARPVVVDAAQAAVAAFREAALQ